jgi:2-C-methyl-D-erythritol 4-phosphate cytidylyltransferase/2-C-methyl-D-erythritol 2,4-cyclodiphosphate synthase
VRGGVRAGVVVPAAGRGSRLGGERPKALVPLRGRPLLLYALETFERLAEVDSVAVAAPGDAVDVVSALAREAGMTKVAAVVPGGADRQASVAQGLRALPPDLEWVVVHDGVRPLVTPELVRAVLEAAAREGAATLALPVEETVKRAEDGWVRSTVERSGLYRVQTPQAFRRDLLEKAHQEAARAGFRGTDDAVLVERRGHGVRLVPGSPLNVKVTVPEDLEVAEALLERRDGPGGTRVGIGFDAHRFGSARPLVLGGVAIPHPRGLVGHSDADVVVHAVMDALLGAGALGDLGTHFPPEDPAYAGARSLDLLARVRDLLASRGWRAAHVDVVVLAERPRLAPYVPAIQAALGSVLGLGPEHVSVKATTLEGMGALGREEGIAAQAVASLAALPRRGTGAP